MRPSMTVTALLLAAVLTGCGSAAKKTDPAPAPAQTETAVQETKAPMTPAERVRNYQKEGEPWLFDELGVLSEEDAGRIGQTLQSRGGAIVITDHLDGKSPDAFAQAYFRALYKDNPDGFLILINNDTNEDLLYSPAYDDGMTDEVIAQATPLLVEGDYAGAIDLLLGFVEQYPILGCGY